MKTSILTTILFAAFILAVSIGSYAQNHNLPKIPPTKPTQAVKPTPQKTVAKPEPDDTTPPAPKPKLVKPEMVFVQGGTFMMGCTMGQGDDFCYDCEIPAHQVTLSSYYIGKCEVTQAQWLAVMGTYPSRFRGDNLPVEQVRWNDVQEFILKLNAQTGKQYRLPTEAEWEYACRGGSQSAHYKYSGSNILNDVAWYKDNSGNATHPVGTTKRPNELGIYDMIGNVWEWCSDWYNSYGSNAQTNPQGPSSGSSRVIRGGSWAYDAKFCRVSYRYYYTPDTRSYDLGFRLACSSN